MAINFDKGTITSWDSLTTFDKNGNLNFILDELQDVTVSNEETKNELTGKGGRVIKVIKSAKSVTISGTNGFVVAGLLAAQLGSEPEKESTVRKIDKISVVKGATKANTTYTATGDAGTEIGTLYISTNQITVLSDAKKLTQAPGTPTTGQFSYDPDTKEITFADGDITEDAVVYAIYDANVTNGISVTNNADTYSKEMSGQIDFTWEDACDGLYHGAIIFNRGTFDGNFELGGSDTITHAFSLDILPDLCNGIDNDLYKIVIFED